MALSKEAEISAEPDGGEKRESASGSKADGADLRESGSASFKSGSPVAPANVGFAAKAKANAEARQAAFKAAEATVTGVAKISEGDGDKGTSTLPTVVGQGEGSAGVSQDWVERPFQRLEFLVRDWQVCLS